MNIYLKYCKDCKQAFDAGTNFDLCHKCRLKNKKQKDGRKRGS
jgi:hypothetical protein